MLLLKLNEFTLNHLIHGLLLNFMLLKLLVIAYKKMWARSHLAFDLQRLSCATNKCHAAIIQAKRSFHASTVSSKSSQTLDYCQ